MPEEGARGEFVDPQVQTLLERMRESAAVRGTIGSAPPDVMRQRFNVDVQAWNAQLPEIGSVSDRLCDIGTADVPVRLYDPDVSQSQLPCLVFLHGGGWVAGDLDTNERTLRLLALESGVRILSVDYPLAPEHRFPEALGVCVAVARWVRAHGEDWGLDPQRIAVGGDSAGGNLALALALDLRDAGESWLQYLMLVYPALSPATNNGRHARFGNGEFGAGSAAMTFFWNSYLGVPGPVTDARADLLLADKTGLPRIDLVSAGLDPLTDDILTLIEQLNEAGSALSHRHYEGVIHGFFSMSLILDAGHLAVVEAAAALKSALFGGDRLT